MMLVIAAAGLLAQEGPPPNGPYDRDADELQFISRPSPTARVNTPYLYTAQAVSSDSTAIIRYSGWFGGGGDPMRLVPLVRFPIDSVTGVTSWTPMLKGWYEIVIVAASNKGGHERQDFNVLVSGGDGTIQGRVTDTLNNAIPNIIVQAMKTDITPLASASDHDGGFYSYSAMTDANGYYKIPHVDLGSYKLRAISPTPDYASQWYDGQTEAALANVVTVADSPNVSTVDFRLRAGPTLHPKVTVSGSIVDTMGAPLVVPNTRIFFVRAGFALNSNATVDDFRESFDEDHDADFRIDGRSPNVFATTADTTGKYTFRVPVGQYISFAEAPGYVTSFYLNQTDFTSADVLTLASDSSGIDFTLAPLPPVVFGSISGTVIDSSEGVGVRARVIAFRDHWRFPDVYRVAESYTTDTDSSGAYSFNQLLPGSYFVLAVPVGSYAPGYYTTDTLSTRWKRATSLTINGNAYTDINIYVRALSASMLGYTGIRGSVQAGAQGPVTGAFVYAMANGQILGYAMSDNSGSYSISGLAPGTYSISVDKAGFDEVGSQSTSVTYSNTSTPAGVTSVPVIQTVNFSISGTTSAPVSVTGAVTNYKLAQNYPNPFNPSTTISFDLPQAGVTTLKVYNILGQEVATLFNGFEKSGAHQVLFDATNLSSGVYFYKLQSGSFVQSRKMVLLK